MMPEKIERTFQRAGTADARHSPRDRAVLDVQIAGADGAQRHPHNGVTGIQYPRHRLAQKGKLAAFCVG